MKSVILLTLLSVAAWGDVKITQDGDRIHVSIDGQPFTDFIMRGGEAQKPYLWPLRTASGVEITRHWPMEIVASEPDEKKYHDHPHQRGLWFAHDEINGVDFWNNEASYKSPPPRGKIVVEKTSVNSGKDLGLIHADMSWLAPDGTKLLRESRDMTFRGTSTLRIIDLDITLTAAVKAAFGDSKDGVLGIRLLPALQENKTVKERGQPDVTWPGAPGTIVNADGKMHEKEAWGKTSDWVDYYGDPGDGSTVGVAILDHPANSRRAHWHVRGYGLFAANPFGEKTFVDSKAKGESVTLEPGGKLHFRYRIVIHSGDTQAAGIAKIWDDFVKK
jgi:hypothetical protein